MASLSFDTEHSEMIVRVVLHLLTSERASERSRQY